MELSAAPPVEAPTQAEAEVPRRRIRNYLIDSGLQLRFASYVVSMAAAISAALGWLLWQAYRETSRVVALLASDASEAIAAQLAREDVFRMVWIASGLVAVVLALLVLAVVVTHRVAGPARVLERTCRAVAEGSLPVPRALRRKDLLVDLAAGVSDMLTALREREERERAVISQAAARLRDDAAGASCRIEAAERLERLAEEKKQRLDA